MGVNKGPQIAALLLFGTPRHKTMTPMFGAVWKKTESAIRHHPRRPELLKARDKPANRHMTPSNREGDWPTLQGAG